MDISPALERLWIDEVRRLHSLWHSGPTHGFSTPDSLAATNTTAFKREERRKRKAQKKRRRKQLQLDQAACSSNPSIPHHGTSSTTSMEWPPPPLADHAPDEVRTWGEEEERKIVDAAPSKVQLEEENAKTVALQVQKGGISACRDFFSERCSSDEEEDLMEEDEDDESDDSAYFKFLMEVFEKNGDLRGYYENNWEKGEFCCLVCSGIREKLGKRFKDCVSLVQHSNSISKTKNKRAHREFAKVVCSVLGWNMERLPSIVLDVSDRRGQSLVKVTTPPLEEDECKNSVLDQEKELQAPDTLEMVHNETMDVTEAEDVPQKDDAEDVPKQVMDHT